MDKMMAELVGNASPEEIQKAMSYSPPVEPLTPVGKVLRTPEDRFLSLKDFPFAPNYVLTKIHGDVRIHYVDEGDKGAKETILLMHGEPTWSYLYRHMIPILVAQGYRVVAPDLVGFGKSDKPAAKSDHSYERQVDWLVEFVVQTGLDRITLFAQDWGGLIGLRVVSRLPERFVRVAISNTGMPVGGAAPDDAAVMGFRMWAGLVSQKLPTWAPLMQSAVARELTAEELRAYDAPFPSEEYKAASRVYPQLVPILDEHNSVEENKGAWKRVFEKWTKPFITLFGDSDPVTQGGEKVWIDTVPGGKSQKHEIIKGGGHFIQEDKPKEVCERLIAFISANPTPSPKL